MTMEHTFYHLKGRGSRCGTHFARSDLSLAVPSAEYASGQAGRADVGAVTTNVRSSSSGSCLRQVLKERSQTSARICDLFL